MFSEETKLPCLKVWAFPVVLYRSVRLDSFCSDSLIYYIAGKWGLGIPWHAYSTHHLAASALSPGSLAQLLALHGEVE